MTVRVDFLQGADSIAPGLSRAQRPLLEALRSETAFDVRPVRFSLTRPELLFPAVYGPLPLWLRLRRASLVHIANGWYAHLVPLVGAPVVVTCHDLIELESLLSHELHVKPHRRFHIRAAYSGMLRARLIVCDSQAVARRLTSLEPGCRERVRVAYLGISPAFSPGEPDPATLRGRGIEQPYVLYVGSEQKRKNLDRLVAAIALARTCLPDLQFVKVGNHQTEEGRSALLQSLRREGLARHTRILDDVSESDLITLYRGAAVTVLASLREGFGFPPLEAMACGCPAIVSNRDSLPEITGGDAPVVDPLDIQDMAHTITRVVSDAELRQALSARGIGRARRYTWQRAARRYAAIYAEALHEP